MSNKILTPDEFRDLIVDLIINKPSESLSAALDNYRRLHAEYDSVYRAVLLGWFHDEPIHGMVNAVEAVMTNQWTKTDEKKYRDEVRIRLRSRMNDGHIDSWVGRSEMRTWSNDNLGKLPPELDEEWLTQFAGWYKRTLYRLKRRATP